MSYSNRVNACQSISLHSRHCACHMWSRDTVLNFSSIHSSLGVKLQVNELPKSTGVVVVNSLCITKGFHDRARQKTKRSSDTALLTIHLYMYIANSKTQSPTWQQLHELHLVYVLVTKQKASDYLLCRIASSTFGVFSNSPVPRLTSDKYFKINFVDSVFPAPDSPLCRKKCQH